MIHTEVETALERPNRVGEVVPLHVPGALPNGGDGSIPQRAKLHLPPAPHDGEFTGSGAARTKLEVSYASTTVRSTLCIKRRRAFSIATEACWAKMVTIRIW